MQLRFNICKGFKSIAVGVWLLIANKKGVFKKELGWGHTYKGPIIVKKNFY